MVCRMHLFGRTLSKLFMNTMDAMTSSRSVRRPRIRTDSEGNRRRQNVWATYARNKTTLKTKPRVWYAYEIHPPGVACKRWSHPQQDLHAFNARRTERETNRRKAFQSDLLRRLESIGDGNEDIANNEHETLSSRKGALCAVHERLGMPTLDGQPCEHCGAHLFAKESNPITRHDGRHPYGWVNYLRFFNTCLCRRTLQ